MKGKATTVSVYSASSILISVPSTIPANTNGLIVVAVSELSSTAQVNFDYFSQPTVSSISPISAQPGGVVSITGAFLGNDAATLTITIGSSSCTQIIVIVQDTIVSCTVGSTVGSVALTRYTTAATGSVTLTLSCATFPSTPAGYLAGTCQGSPLVNAQTCTQQCALDYTLTSGSLTFTCKSTGAFNNPRPVCTLSNPVISSITPAGGVPGSDITIAGTYFDAGNAAVTVGGLSCNLNPPVLATQIICTTPTSLTPPANGKASNVIVTTLGTANSNTYGWFAINQPTITSVTPAAAHRVVGQPITIVGTNFGSILTNLGVTVAGQTCTNLAIITNKTKVSCVLPVLQGAVVLTEFATTATFNI